MNEHLREAYLAGHKACGLKKGDYVEVLRMPESFEQGWDWNITKSMRASTIGTIREITGDKGSEGFELNGDLPYPWFVLEKVEDAKPDILDGLDFGCQQDNVSKLIERLDKRYGVKE